MITLDTFRKTIDLLKENDLQYWVFGGFALDGLRGRLTREHSDIDIYLNEKDLAALTDSFGPGYKVYKRENMYFVESTELKLGIVLLTAEGDQIIVHGNKTLAKYPKELFARDNFANIDDVRFRIAPNEALVLESQFSKHESDKVFAKQIHCNKQLYDRIETVRLR